MPYINSREGQTPTLEQHTTHSMMNKFTTDKYDGQRCQVSIVSSSITVQGEHNAVEIQYLDETQLLNAVCSYIRYRYMDSDCEATQRKLAAAFLELGKSIDSAKAAD